MLIVFSETVNFQFSAPSDQMGKFNRELESLLKLSIFPTPTFRTKIRNTGENQKNIHSGLETTENLQREQSFRQNLFLIIFLEIHPPRD